MGVLYNNDMEYICDEEGCRFVAKTPASLASHKHYKHGVKAKPNSKSGTVVNRLEAIADRLEEKVDSSNHHSSYICPVCGGELELISDTPINVGIYKLRCSKCYEA